MSEYKKQDNNKQDYTKQAFNKQTSNDVSIKELMIIFVVSVLFFIMALLVESYVLYRLN
jgi:hypothetical protein